MTQFNQENRENIINYLKQTNNFVYKMINNNDKINVNIIMLQDIKNQFKRN